MQRRDFLKQPGSGAVLTDFGSFAGMFARFPTPNTVTAKVCPVEIGTPEEYAMGTMTHVEAARTYVGRDRDQRGSHALVATCTHLGCTSIGGKAVLMFRP